MLHPKHRTPHTQRTNLGYAVKSAWRPTESFCDASGSKSAMARSNNASFHVNIYNLMCQCQLCFSAAHKHHNILSSSYSAAKQGTESQFVTERYFLINVASIWPGPDVLPPPPPPHAHFDATVGVMEESKRSAQSHSASRTPNASPSESN